MPATIHPMLAESVEKPFDGAEWLFEIKWDGYRAVAFIDGGKVRLVSRNQNDLTPRYPELKDMAQFIKAKTAILDGEVVALDEEGKASFSLMQQRTGFRPGGRRAAANADVPVLITRSICCISMATTGGACRWRSASASWRRWWWRAMRCAIPITTKSTARRCLRWRRRRGWKASSPRSARVFMKSAAAASG